MRTENRKFNEMREIKLELGYLKHHEGSVMITMGNTKVLAVTTSEPKVPPHRYEIGGWLSAEYNMLPGATKQRKPRAIQKLKNDGRTVEISRLIGRCLRQAVDIDALGQRTLNIDCDVISADGGTRSAAITAGYIATVLHVAELLKSNQIKMKTMEDIIIRPVAAISLGLVKNTILCDLDYEEDSKAQMDLNLIGTLKNDIIELQCTAEEKPVSQTTVNEIITLGQSAIEQILAIQKRALMSKGIFLHHE